MAFSANAEKQEAGRRIANETTTARLSRPVLARSLSACGAPICSRPRRTGTGRTPIGRPRRPGANANRRKTGPPFGRPVIVLALPIFCGQSPGNYRRRK